MRKPNQKQQPINNSSANTASTNLFQSISDEQAETIKGGWFPWGGAGDRFYCPTTRKIKEGKLDY